MWFYKSDSLQNPVAKTYIKSGGGIFKIAYIDWKLINTYFH